MATSGTYDFLPGLGELVLYSFNMAGVRSTALTQEHMFSARMAVNMMQASWSNQGVNLWAVDLISVPLVQGVATYDVDPDTVMILDSYMAIVPSSGPEIDRIILPVSRTEYASYPNKTQQGFTTVFWFDRLISPTITLWPVPDGSSAQFLKYYRVRQIQDAVMAGNIKAEIPYRFLDAYADGLAFRLSKIWNPAIAPQLKAVADESYGIATRQDVENVEYYISPQIGGYFRP